MQQRTQTLAHRFDIVKLTLTLNSPHFALPPLCSCFWGKPAGVLAACSRRLPAPLFKEAAGLCAVRRQLYFLILGMHARVWSLVCS